MDMWVGARSSLTSLPSSSPHQSEPETEESEKNHVAMPPPTVCVCVSLPQYLYVYVVSFSSSLSYTHRVCLSSLILPHFSSLIINYYSNVELSNNQGRWRYNTLPSHIRPCPYCFVSLNTDGVGSDISSVWLLEKRALPYINNIFPFVVLPLLPIPLPFRGKNWRCIAIMCMFQHSRMLQ